MKRLAILDFETDPFEFGAVPEPFLAGYYDGFKLVSFWGSDCASKMVASLMREYTPLCIYAHNGGKFDFFYLLDYLSTGSIRIINGRIIQAKLGQHELRDSFAIMPFALDKYKKTKIDYAKFHKSKRESNRAEIESYWRDDLTGLYELVVGFTKEFGDKLTIGGASMKELQKFHSFERGNENFDRTIRSQFYFGGRNQVFEAGSLPGKWKVFDVNSAYPFSMKAFLHPVGTAMHVGKRITHDTCFLSVEGTSDGAFPVRTKSGGLDFTVKSGVFHTSIHEYRAAIDTGAFKLTKIVKTYDFEKREFFAEFVDHFYKARKEADRTGDAMHKLFYKFVLNSSYGKFAQNPENYFDWEITNAGDRPYSWHDCGESCDTECRLMWLPAYVHGKFVIWQRPVQTFRYFNVATGASITGAARSLLLRGIKAATRPIYCDTDSIICEDISGVPMSEEDLGAWKLEAIGDQAYICGKKLYAIYDGADCIKKAHKGVRITGDQIRSIAGGSTVEASNPVPSFRWDGTSSFVTRRVRRTA